MFKRHLKATVSALLLGLLAGSPPVATATHAVLSRETNGLIVYLGVVPAKRLNDHAELLPAGHAIRTGKDMYHIVVALFDKSTGRRIDDAVVEATVAPFGLSGPTRIMYPTAPAGMLNYCNWFRLSSGDIYVIHVTVRRPGIQTMRTAEFTLRRFSE